MFRGFPNHARLRLALPVLACTLLLTPAGSLAQEKDKQEKAEEAKKKESAAKKKPRVITNADLEKYGKRPRPGQRTIVRPAPAVPLPADPEPPPPAGRSLPPEDRLDQATLPELEAREVELQALLSYLEAKEAWLRNPLLPAPPPPPGEVFLDPELSGAEEFEQTRSRAFSVRGRLGKVRLLIQSGGSQTPAVP
jgi:hypothetical protein